MGNSCHIVTGVLALCIVTTGVRGAEQAVVSNAGWGGGWVAATQPAAGIEAFDEYLAVAGAERAAATLGPMAQSHLTMLYRGDLDGDGQVTYAEQMESSTRQYEQQLGPEKAAAWRKQQQEQMRRYLDQYDADGDGQVSAAEQASANRKRMQEYYEQVERTQGREAAMRMREQREQQMAPYLERYDLNDDGEVTADETQQVMRQEAMRLRAEWEQRRVLHLYDADGDGMLNTDERAKMKADGERRDAELRARLDATKKLYDVDGNGVIDEAERAAMRQKVEAMLSQIADVELLAMHAERHGDRSLTEVAKAIRAARFERATLDAGGTERDDDNATPSPRPLVDDR